MDTYNYISNYTRDILWYTYTYPSTFTITEIM